MIWTNDKHIFCKFFMQWIFGYLLKSGTSTEFELFAAYLVQGSLYAIILLSIFLGSSNSHSQSIEADVHNKWCNGMVRSWKSRTITMNLHTAFVCSVNARRIRNNSLCKWTEHRRNELFARRKTRSIFHINFECVQWIKHQNIAHSLHITQCLSLWFFSLSFSFYRSKGWFGSMCTRKMNKDLYTLSSFVHTHRNWIHSHWVFVCVSIWFIIVLFLFRCVHLGSLVNFNALLCIDMLKFVFLFSFSSCS